MECIGYIAIDPPLNPDEVAYLVRFSRTRRMRYVGGPYVTDEFDHVYYEVEDVPTVEHPSMWCQWIPTADGSAIQWDGVPRFDSPVEWMNYLINVFLCRDSILQNEVTANAYPNRWYAPEFANFTFDHVLNGVIEIWNGDRCVRYLTVENNNVRIIEKGMLGHSIPLSITAEDAAAREIRNYYNGGVAPLPDGVVVEEPEDMGEHFAAFRDESLELANPPYAAEEDDVPYEERIKAPLTDGEITAINTALAMGAAPRFRRRVQFWHIWSNKHQLWWGPNRHGYFHHQAQAGKYTTRDAVEIMNDHLKGSTLGQNRFVPDVMLIPAERE